MREIIYFIYSTYIRLSSFLKRLNVQIKQSKLFKCKLHLIRNNAVFFHHCKCSRSIFSVEGEKNFISVKGTIHNSNVKIVGTGNKLFINDVHIDKMRLVIRGNNCIVKIGKGSTIGEAFIVCMGQTNSIVIGEKCMLSEKVDIWNTDSHPIYDKNGIILNKSKPINIGNKVWLGKDVKILKGVSIGEGAIVGMGAIVTKNLNPYSLYVGNPIKMIKENVSWDNHFIEI